MWRVGFKFGLAASIVLVGWMMMEHELGFNTTKHNIGQYTRILPPFIFYFFIYIALSTRKSHQGNVLFFKHGVQSGALTTIIYSSISTVWIYFYSTLINPFFYSTLVEYETKTMQENNTSVVDTAAKLQELEMTYGGSTLSFIMFFVFNCVIGMIVTLIISYFLRTKKKQVSS